MPPVRLGERGLKTNINFIKYKSHIKFMFNKEDLLKSSVNNYLLISTDIKLTRSSSHMAIFN